eukprot:SAG22_NODE_1137_length_5394_cov_15.206232_2_plen_207_part_00
MFSKDCLDQTLTATMDNRAQRQLTDIRLASPHPDALVQLGRADDPEAAAVSTYLGGPAAEAEDKQYNGEVPAVPWQLVGRAAANETELAELQALGGGGSPLMRGKDLQPHVVTKMPGGKGYATKFTYEVDCPGGGDAADAPPKATARVYRQRRVMEYAVTPGGEYEKDGESAGVYGHRHAATLTKRVIIDHDCGGWFHVSINVGAF